MTEQRKRKISGRKILQALVTLVVTAGCVVAILGASGVHDRRTVGRMEIHIANKKSCGFLDETQVRDMLLGSRHIRLDHTPLSGLDLQGMEAILRANPWVATAEVYVDNATVLHVYIRQRVPAYRVFEQDGNSYYVDNELKALPLSDRYTHYTSVVTNVPVLRDDSAGNSLKTQLYHVAGAISRDTFWRAQVTEIRLADDGTFELIPVLGSHRIILGDTSRIEQKLDHVFAFYRQVLNRIGWNRYQVINVSYRGQVVASPSLPWKPPKDKAMSNMSWVKSIMGNTPPDNSASAITTTQSPVPAQQATASAATAHPPAAVRPASPERAVAAPVPPAQSPGQAKPPVPPPQPATGKEREDRAAQRPAPQEKAGKKTAGKETEKNNNTNQPKYIYQGN